MTLSQKLKLSYNCSAAKNDQANHYLTISQLWGMGAKITHCYFIQNQMKYFWHILWF